MVDFFDLCSLRQLCIKNCRSLRTDKTTWIKGSEESGDGLLYSGNVFCGQTNWYSRCLFVDADQVFEANSLVLSLAAGLLRSWWSYGGCIKHHNSSHHTSAYITDHQTPPITACRVPLCFIVDWISVFGLTSVFSDTNQGFRC